MRTACKQLCLLLAATTSIPAHAEGLGRLFFSPEQRKQLDQEQTHQTTSGANELKLNGIVQQHSGPRTVWINGKPRSVDSGVQAPDTLAITLPGHSRPIRVKVGQKVVIPADTALPQSQQRSPDK